MKWTYLWAITEMVWPTKAVCREHGKSYSLRHSLAFFGSSWPHSTHSINEEGQDWYLSPNRIPNPTLQFLPLKDRSQEMKACAVWLHIPIDCVPFTTKKINSRYKSSNITN